jgi:hypothetical protein
MSEPRAQRTLVKSPPELWAEISDVSTLARHLGEFGDIRITRLEAETTVVWEGDRARGTVNLEPSGWGTKVTITAEAIAEEAAEAAEETAIVEEPAVEDEPQLQAETATDAQPVGEAPAAVTADLDDEPEAEPEPVLDAPRRRGLFARLFARRARPAALEPEPVAEEAEPPAPEPPAPEPEPQTPALAEAIHVPTVAAPEPVEVTAAAPEPITEPALDGEISATAPGGTLADDQVEAVLVGVLDDLGSAHHRPFSRG